MRPIFLIGYMGSGKTTLGQTLSLQYGIKHIDLDWHIEQRFHTKISDMFTQIGEDEFRKREKNMLHEVMNIENVVISVGGGTPCFFDNMEQMNIAGITIYLQCDVDTLIERILHSPYKRPIVANKTRDELIVFVTKHIAEREVFYLKSQYIWDTKKTKFEELKIKI